MSTLSARIVGGGMRAIVIRETSQKQRITSGSLLAAENGTPATNTQTGTSYPKIIHY